MVKEVEKPAKKIGNQVNKPKPWDIAPLRLMHGLIDGCYLSVSMVDYGADCTTARLDLQELREQQFYSSHDLPWAIVETIGVTLLVMVGNYFDRKDDKGEKHPVGIAWLYLRNTLSGLKNGRRAAILAHACNPAAIAVGALYAVLLIGRCYVRGQREGHIKKNKKYRDEKIIDFYRIRPIDRGVGYGLAAIDGVIDGMYLFCWLMLLVNWNIVSLGGAMLALAIVVCSLYVLASLVYKVETEHKQQQALEQSTKKELSTQPTPESLAWFIGRAALIGIKNMKMAVDVLSRFFKIALQVAVLAILIIPYAVYLILKQAGQYFDAPNWKQYAYCTALLPLAFLLAPFCGVYLLYQAICSHQDTIQTPISENEQATVSLHDGTSILPRFFKFPKWTESSAEGTIKNTYPYKREQRVV